MELFPRLSWSASPPVLVRSPLPSPQAPCFRANLQSWLSRDLDDDIIPREGHPEKVLPMLQQSRSRCIKQSSITRAKGCSTALLNPSFACTEPMESLVGLFSVPCKCSEPVPWAALALPVVSSRCAPALSQHSVSVICIFYIFFFFRCGFWPWIITYPRP